MNHLEEVHKRLCQLFKSMVKHETTRELWDRIFTAKDWDEEYLEAVKEELKQRSCKN